MVRDTGQNRLKLEFTCSWCGWSRVPGSASCAKVRLMSERRAGQGNEIVENEIMLWGGACRKGSYSLSDRLWKQVPSAPA